jgi:predicted Zn finger-like uncharacterized protein
MALATICPHCNTTFRVASDQLKLRGGIVRCGACNEVFDGNAALIDFEAIAAHQADEAAPPPPPVPSLEETLAPDEPPSDDAPAEVAPEQSASAAFDAEIAAIEAQQTEEAEESIYTLDFDTTFDPFGILPKSALPAPEPETECEAEPEPEPEPEPAVDEEIIALPMPEEEDEPADAAPGLPEAPAHDEAAELHPPLLMRASAAPPPLPELQGAIAKSARRNAAKRKKAEKNPVVPAEPEAIEPEVDEPEFVKRSRLQEQTGRTRRIVMGAGSALLVLALAAQGLSTFRNVLAARFPQTKPVLVATCAVFGCKVELPAQIDTLSVETGELQSLGANTFSFTTVLRNQGSLVQAWPHIELALTDANDKPLVRRVFTPAEYLPQSVAPARGFGARSEQPVKLFFELNQVKASGYHLAIFYP